MNIYARLCVWSLALCCASYAPGTPSATTKLAKQIVGRWANQQTGVEFRKDGTFGFYREAGERVYKPGRYKVAAPNRIKVERDGASQEWVVKKITPEVLVVLVGGRDEALSRTTKGVGLKPLDAYHCEINMRTILTVEEQYKIDHAVYKPVGPSESFVTAGLFSKEPRCPSGGRYTVTVGDDGAVAVHCSRKDHDFNGRGVR